MSPGHFLPIWKKGVIAARHVAVGDYVYTPDGLAIVVSISLAVDYGLYAPVTMSGVMVVDGVVVSCFTEIVKEPAAMALLAPLRWLFRSGGRLGSFVVGNANFLHGRSAVDFVKVPHQILDIFRA